MAIKRCLSGCWLSLVIAAAPLAAQPANPPDGGHKVVREGWHVVRPGESLWVIAARYLGSEEEWKTLHALNPQITNPHRIAPGQRIRVQVRESYIGDVAQVIGFSGRVEEQLVPNPWTPSELETLLKPRDGQRTYENSSSELLFADDSRLVLSEDSLVFLGEGGKVERQVRRDEIEIVMGQGDFDGGLEAKTREFVVGGSRVKPQTGEVIQTRLRRFDSGNNQVMVYEGESAVESGGASATIERGMGTQMVDGAPPAEPEPLLPAATPGTPEAASEWRFGNPPFAWSEVAGAASYVLEVCADTLCGQLVSRTAGLEELTTDAVELPVGSFFWRVTAVSPSGLDGYPSAATPFSILATGADATPPTIEAAFTGPRVERAGTLYLGVGAGLEVAAHDGESGIETVWGELDGETVDLAAAQGPYPVGPHRVVIHARDRAGNEAASAALEFVSDTVAPEIHWGVESGGLYHTYVGEQEPVARPGAARGPRSPKLEWSLDRRSWSRLAGGESVQRDKAPRVYLRSGGRRLALYGAENAFLRVGRRLGVGILANDRLVGTERLDFRLDQGGDGGARDPRLIVEAVDFLGNRSSVSWPLGRGRRPGSR